MKKLIFILIIIAISYLNLAAKWEHLYTGFPSPDFQITLLGSDSGNPNNIFAGHGPDLYLSTNKGMDWHYITSCEENDLGISCIDVKDSIILIGTLGRLYKSTNFGKSWEILITKYYNQDSTFFYLNRFTSVTFKGNNIYVGTYRGAYRSFDWGVNWYSLTSPEPFKIMVTSMIISSNEIYISYFPNGFIYSKNNGNNWIYYNDDIYGQGIDYLAISGKYLLAVSEGAIYMSIDSVKSLIKIYQPLNYDWDAYDLAVCGNNIYATTSLCGIIFSSDYGKNWVTVNDGLNYQYAYSILVNGDYIYAGTGTVGEKGGFYRHKLKDCQLDTSTVDVWEPPPQQPLAVFPNPAGDVLHLTGEPPPYGTVRLYSPTGIKMLECEFKPEIDISRLPRGVYILQIGNKVEKVLKI